MSTTAKEQDAVCHKSRLLFQNVTADTTTNNSNLLSFHFLGRLGVWGERNLSRLITVSSAGTEKDGCIP
jgi:hypothetical protein